MLKPIPLIEGWKGNRFPNIPFTINRNSPQADGLVGWWPMLANRGIDWLMDFGGLKNNGTLVGNTAWIPDGVHGFVLDFDGTNDYVEVSSDPSLENFTMLSLSTWFYPTGRPSNDWARVISKAQGAGSDDYALTYSRQRKVACRINTDVITRTVSTVRAVNENTGWYFITAIWDGAVIKIYIDGVDEPLDGVATAGGTLDNSSDDLGIGGHVNSASRRLEGFVTDARVYNYDLSSDLIADIFNPQTRYDLYLPLAPSPYWMIPFEEIPVSVRIPRIPAAYNTLAIY